MDPVGMPDPHDCAQHEDYRNIRPQVRVLIRVKESLWDHYQAVQQVSENAEVEQGRVRPRIAGPADQQLVQLLPDEFSGYIR